MCGAGQRKHALAPHTLPLLLLLRTVSKRPASPWPRHPSHTALMSAHTAHLQLPPTPLHPIPSHPLIQDVFNETRTILEPAGAVALAGAKAYLQYNGLTGKRVVAVTSGGNMNFDRLRLVSGGLGLARVY